MKQFSLFLLLAYFCFSCANSENTLKKQPTSKPESQKLSNLNTFAKLYGYVKYFHPSDEAASINWDYFAIYGAKQVEKAQNNAELKNTLQELFLPIAPSLKLYEKGDKVKFDISTITPANKEDLQAITWQHLGVGFGAARSVYKSIRTNRKIAYTSVSGYSSVVKKIDAKSYRNKEVKLVAQVKTDFYSDKGIAHLWFRVDNNGVFKRTDRAIKSRNWQQYEISGTLDANADTLHIGITNVMQCINASD